MMREDISPFSLQIKLVNTKDRFDIQEELINNQPKIISDKQDNLDIPYEVTKKHLKIIPKKDKLDNDKIRWKWSLRQKEQVMPDDEYCSVFVIFPCYLLQSFKNNSLASVNLYKVSAASNTAAAVQVGFSIGQKALSGYTYPVQ